ncbi:MAG TPA: hypothetical protein VFU65_06290 [Actinocrinis sp.]|nr:hypothetical protein [Actinocrinis sp.]
MSTETPWSTPLPSPHSNEDPQLPFLRRPEARDDATALAVVAVASVALSFGVGALWRSLTPAVQGVVNQGGVYYAAPEGETFVARDGWFALFACLAAILLALFAFLRYRRGGSVGAAIALAGGGIGGGYLAAWFGAQIGPGGGSILQAAHGVANGATFALPMSVRAIGVIWLWPAVAAGVFFFLMLLFGPSDPEPEHLQFPGWETELNDVAPRAAAFPLPFGAAAAGHGQAPEPPQDESSDETRSAHPDQRPD